MALFTSVGVSLAYNWVGDIMLVHSVFALMRTDSLKVEGIENETIEELIYYISIRSLPWTIIQYGQTYRVTSYERLI